MDWADENADELFCSVTLKELTEDAQPACDRIAAALRKAKADGMRDAARIVLSKSYTDNDEFAAGYNAAVRKGFRAILAIARLLERTKT